MADRDDNFSLGQRYNTRSNPLSSGVGAFGGQTQYQGHSPVGLRGTAQKENTGWIIKNVPNFLP